MALTLSPSTLYESWIARLRLPWMGPVGRRVWGGFAAALGDRTIDWMLQAALEHLPAYASAPSLALIARERLMDTAPNESTESIAARAPYQRQLWRFAGSPLGLLLGLYYAGFPNAVVVQQNGRAYSLTLPLPAFGPGWDPTPNLVTTVTSQLAVALTSSVVPPTALVAGRSVPAGNPWWSFDNSNTDFSSRFAVLFPGPLPGAFLTWATVPFSAALSGTATWNNVFPDTTYKVRVASVTVTDGGGAVSVSADGTTQTTTGIGLVASQPFTGSADVIAYQTGACPYADLHPADLARLQGVIRKWRPAKATCVGVYAVAQGSVFGWPVATWGTRTTTGPATIVSYAGA